MKNKTTRFLALSLAVVAVLCVSVFSFLLIFMQRQSKATISQVGTIYMTGMSEQIAMHFSTTIELRLSQMSALVETIPPGSASHEELSENLAFSAHARGFDYLALLTAEGNFEMIYGDQVSLIDPDPFIDSMYNRERKVAVGTDRDGRKIVLMGSAANYCLPDGEDSIALVAGLPASYISQTLSLDEEDALVYSHIIRKDGSFVIRSGSAFRENYFDRIRAIFDDVDGEQAEKYVADLQAAMAAGEDYSAVLEAGSLDRRHLYCTKLDYSEWYLVTVMPYGELNSEVSRLSREWACIAILGCGAVLLTLLLIFSRYFKLTRQQIRDLDEARRVAEKANKAKGEFLSNMSHDIRTPMNAIVGMTAIAIANSDNHQQVQNCLKKIALSSKHLLGLINDVLDMSKIESGKMTLNMDLVSLREVMDSIVSIVQPQVKAKQQRFDVIIRDISVENVCCDSVRLNQVLLNLLSNAIKFTPEDGVIQVTLYEEGSPKGEEWIRVHLRVKDSGIGMAEDFQEKIFESFSREDSTRVHKTEGTGLGMAITKYIVDTMGGEIQLNSALGKGTEFHVILDLEKAMEQEADMVLPSWHMLVVDDDEQLCQSAVASLKEIGIQAEWTLDGESALKMVEEQCKKHDNYQIILLDWKLPGIDGIETARRIRKVQHEDVSILLISAYDWSEIEDDARSVGVNGFISKPLFKSTLFYGLKPFAGMSELLRAPEEQETGFDGWRVLLAEDNELNWEIANELLTGLGLELDWAENGQLCLEKFQQSPVGYYKAVLMDIRMPVMTGYQATEAIRALDRADAASVPIIAMTADAFAEDIKRCLDCGMDAHVAKPIDIQEVVRQLKKYVKE
ncbi:MAG: response regulator [Oscillospiraceae bacterium]|nr:response regulator [Oscillospiraceae bacterium]